MVETRIKTEEVKVFNISHSQRDARDIYVIMDKPSLSFLKDPWGDYQIAPTKIFEEADLVIFNGGTDINPTLYGETIGPFSQSPDHLRDSWEKDYFAKAVKAKKPILGICRGAQLACALSGGKIIQDVSGHGMSHAVVDSANKTTFMVNSMHHQMMMPYNLPDEDYDVLLYSTKETRRTTIPSYKGQTGNDYRIRSNGHELLLKDVDYFKEPEAVYFKKTNALAVQWHPEMMTRNGYYNAALEWLNNEIFALIYDHKYATKK